MDEWVGGSMDGWLVDMWLSEWVGGLIGGWGRWVDRWVVGG